MALAPPLSVRARWAIRLALIGYVALLATSALTPGGRAGAAGAGLFDLTTGSRVRAVLFALAVYVLLETVRFLPVGLLAVLCLPRTRGDRFSLLAVTAMGGAGSLIIVVVVLGLEIGPAWTWPGPSDLLLPAAGCVLGVGTALGWLAGRGARRRLLLGLGAMVLAAPLLAGLVLLGTAEREPFVRDTPAVTSEEKRRLYNLLRDKNQEARVAGATRSLSLDSHDIDVLLAWGLPLVLGEGRGAARVDLLPSRTAQVSLTLPLGTLVGGARYLNIVAGARLQIDQGRVSVADPTLRLGRLALPGPPLRWLAPVIGGLVQAERRARPVLAGVESFEIGPGRVTSRLPPHGASTGPARQLHLGNRLERGDAARRTVARRAFAGGRSAPTPWRAPPRRRGGGGLCPRPRAVRDDEPAGASRTGRPSSPWACCSGIGMSRASWARSWTSGTGGGPRRWRGPRSAAATTGRSTSS